MDDDLVKAYVADLQMLLTPPRVSTRSGEAARPVSPYADADIEAALRFLDQSALLEGALWQKWQEAPSPAERSRAEVQLLAAAAADLAIAERLLAPNLDAAARGRKRSTTGGNEDLIKQALVHPDELLAPTLKPVAFRGDAASKKALIDATYKCLDDIEARTFGASKDALEGLLLMPLAALKEAAEMLGVDVAEKLRQSTVAALRLAVEYILKATAKIRLLLGEQGEEQIKKGVADFLDQLKDDKKIRQAIERWIDKMGIYEQGKGWIEAYAGDDARLVAARDQIIVLQGSFAGRARIADVVVKGLAVAKVALALQMATLPWAQLAAAAAYIGVAGFVLYSALDHADSDRFRSFDRVHGVRGILKTELGISDA